MTLMGAVTRLHFTFLPGVQEAKVPGSSMPSYAEGWTGKVRGSWRGHMDALWYVVYHILPSAIIFEDDLDWDVRIRSQASDFNVCPGLAGAAAAVERPTRRICKPYLPDGWVQRRTSHPPILSFDQLPITEPPLTSPYGDGWDLLWLGHCGVQQPFANPKDGEWAARSAAISKGAVLKVKDATVPQPKDIHSWDDNGHARFREAYPSHSRITHHSLDAVCTFAYAVSQAGARKILYELGLWKMDDPFDLGLRQFCDGIMGHERHICLTTQPSLFSHYEHKEGSELDHEKTWNIRWSVRENLPKLLDGQTGFDDQWPSRLWKDWCSRPAPSVADPLKPDPSAWAFTYQGCWDRPLRYAYG